MLFVIIVIVIIVICLRKKHKEEIKEVIMRANTQNSSSPLYRNPSGLSDSNMHDINNVSYDRAADISVISNRHSYQGLSPAADTNFYELLDSNICPDEQHHTPEFDEIDGDSGYSNEQNGDTLPEEPSRPEPPPPRTLPAVSAYEYIDPTKMEPMPSSVTRTAGPVDSEAAYLQILPNTPRGTPVHTPEGTPRNDRRGTSPGVHPGQPGPRGGEGGSFLHSGHLRASDSTGLVPPQQSEDGEDDTTLVDNHVYAGNSSKKGLASVATPDNVVEVSQL